MIYAALIRRSALPGGALVTALVVDFITKWLIVTIVMVPPRTIEIVPFFNLTISFNTGVSFGMFREFLMQQPLLLAGMSVVVAAALFVWAVRTTKRIEKIALGLITGGALGNVVDRVRHGAVTDFLDFHVGDWHWPTFNIADVMISIGVMLLIIDSLGLARSTVSDQEQLSRDWD